MPYKLNRIVYTLQLAVTFNNLSFFVAFEALLHICIAASSRMWYKFNRIVCTLRSHFLNIHAYATVENE